LTEKSKDVNWTGMGGFMKSEAIGIWCMIGMIVILVVTAIFLSGVTTIKP
jgi:hypothetical protein